MINLSESPHQTPIENFYFESEFFELSEQIRNSLEIWSEYFKLTRTRCSQLTRGFLPIERIELNETDLIKYQLCLSQLHQTRLRLENEHQRRIDRFDSSAGNENEDWILLGLSSMFYSIIQLAHSILQLGTTIHEVFELETTNLYQPF